MPSAATALRCAAVCASASRLAAELLLLFEQVASRPDKLQWVHRELLADLAGPTDPALARACAAVAAVVDADPAAFDRHAYHNRQHYCEVALTAYGLCLLEGLDVASTQLVLLAALIHDVVHAGSPQPAFIQERASVESLRPQLQAAGLAAAQMDRLMALVLATEPTRGTGFMAAAWRGSRPPAPADAPELAALLADPALARLARIVCEADVLPSMGLGAAHAQRVQQRLAREWGRPLGRRDKLTFVEGVLRQGYLGDFFRPSVNALREVLSAESHAVAHG